MLFQTNEMEGRYRETVNRWLTILGEVLEVSPPPETVWKPKFPDIQWPKMIQEKGLTPYDWERSNFPRRELQEFISGNINSQAWHDKIVQLSQSNNPPWGLIRTMMEVETQLTSGVNSGVKHPGTTRTHSPNLFQDPEVQIPRVVDALASFTSKGHMAGPLFPKDETLLKINSIMAVNKPGGHVRVVGNLKHPVGLSFNDGISDEEKKLWPVIQATAADFAKRILNAGNGLKMACTNL